MICFDTMVLIWGVQGAYRDDGGEEKVEKTKRFLSYLEKEREVIMVPTPVVTEYLQHFSESDRKLQLQKLRRYFVFQAFDLPSAFLAAELAHGPRPNSEGIPRQAVKTDIQIIATAIVHGASKIITDNLKHFRKLSDGRIPVSEVPSIPEQTNINFE